MAQEPEELLGRPFRPQEVWPFPEHLGFRRSIDSAGAVAAPLLAGFSLTLLVLILPSLPRTPGGAPAAAADAKAFSAAPEIAAILFLVAGLLLIGSVQAAITMRYYSHTPGDLEQSYPQYFRTGQNGAAPDVGKLRLWDSPWPPQAVDDKWYGGWVRSYLFSQLLIANRWARAARWLYHLGIVSLLLGLTVAVFPPEDARSTERWVLSLVAAAGAIGEIIWIFGIGQKTKAPARPSQTAPEPGAEPAPAAPSEVRLSGDGPLVSAFAALVGGLPPDWTTAELDLRVDESRYIDAATSLVQVNAQPYSWAEWHWRLIVTRRSGHGAPPEVVRATLRLLDRADIAGELVLREWRAVG